MRHWVFDLDGTLIDSHAIYYNTLNLVLDFHGTSLTEKDKNEIIKTPLKGREEFFAKKLGAASAKAALQMLDMKLVDDHRKVLPFMGIPELLRSLKDSGTKMAVCTARDLKSAQFSLEHTKLADFFSLCVSGTCVEECKPAPDGLIRIAEHFGCDPSDIIMVGDHDNDMNAAKACGARAIRAQWHSPDPKTICTVSDYQFADVQDLLKWILEMKKQ
jgi:phosphoglycolate phosphatase